MGIVKTYEWLKAYIEEASAHRRIGDLARLQLELLVKPLFQDVGLHEQLEKYRFLLEQGLFSVNEKIEKEVAKLIERRTWHLCAYELKKLQRIWNGPDIRVYLFPASEKQADGKNGMFFENRLFLFVRSSCSDDEIRALLTHEYHHACRFSIQKYNEFTIPLIESIVMEGLAEYAVKEYVGENQLAYWTTFYSNERLLQLWKQVYKERSHLKGRIHHTPFLYGSSELGVPRLAGYAIGYFLVTNYVKQFGTTSTVELFQVSAEEISKKS